jgi:hypothetical protein
MKTGLKAVVLTALIGLVDCRTVGTRDMPPLTDVEAASHLRSIADARMRVSGSYSARLPGLQGLVMKVAVDVAAESDGRLMLAVQSFFGTPSHIIVNDGKNATLFDATGDGAGQPVAYRSPSDTASLARVFGLPLTPRLATLVLLQRPDVPVDTRVRVVAATADNWTARVEHAAGSAEEWTVRRIDDAPLALVSFHADGRRLFDVRFGRETSRSGVVFFDEATLSTSTREVVWVASDITLNGVPTAPDAFSLDLPASVPVRPLR